MITDSLRQHKTIRKYLKKDIPDELLNDLLEAASHASTVGNMQLYSVVVTRSSEGKKRLAPAHFNQPMVTEAPVVLTFCIDLHRFNSWCEQRNAIPSYNNAEWFLNGAIDALLFAQNFCVAAEEQGLGFCYLGTTTYNPQQIINALKLPKSVFPITTLTVGWKAEEPALTDRLPIESIIHQEAYNPNIDIDKIYAYKESLPENQHFVHENNKENLAQVFTDVRYPKADNEYFSQELLKAIKSQGF